MLSKCMGDSKAIIEKLDTVVTTPVIVFIIFIALFVYQVDLQSIFITFSSALVAAAVVFGTSLVSLVESLTFLFVVRPFDVGDMIMCESDTYVVKKIELFSTTLVDGSDRISYWPNTILAKQHITNFAGVETSGTA